jgi:hypothetical protein
MTMSGSCSYRLTGTVKNQALIDFDKILTDYARTGKEAAVDSFDRLLII